MPHNIKIGITDKQVRYSALTILKIATDCKLKKGSNRSTKDEDKRTYGWTVKL